VSATAVQHGQRIGRARARARTPVAISRVAQQARCSGSAGAEAPIRARPRGSEHQGERFDEARPNASPAPGPRRQRARIWGAELGAGRRVSRSDLRARRCRARAGACASTWPSSFERPVPGSRRRRRARRGCRARRAAPRGTSHVRGPARPSRTRPAWRVKPDGGARRCARPQTPGTEHGVAGECAEAGGDRDNRNRPHSAARPHGMISHGEDVALVGEAGDGEPGGRGTPRSAWPRGASTAARPWIGKRGQPGQRESAAATSPAAITAARPGRQPRARARSGGRGRLCPDRRCSRTRGRGRASRPARRSRGTIDVEFAWWPVRVGGPAEARSSPSSETSSRGVRVDDVEREVAARRTRRRSPSPRTRR